jgi:hypothetical protein
MRLSTAAVLVSLSSLIACGAERDREVSRPTGDAGPRDWRSIDAGPLTGTERACFQACHDGSYPTDCPNSADECIPGGDLAALLASCKAGPGCVSRGLTNSATCAQAQCGASAAAVKERLYIECNAKAAADEQACRAWRVEQQIECVASAPPEGCPEDNLFSLPCPLSITDCSP